MLRFCRRAIFRVIGFHPRFLEILNKTRVIHGMYKKTVHDCEKALQCRTGPGVCTAKLSTSMKVCPSRNLRFRGRIVFRDLNKSP